MRTRNSISGFVRSVRPSVGPSVQGHRVEKWENEHLRYVLGMGWGVYGGWMPLPTRPQRYCDPASLVVKFGPSTGSFLVACYVTLYPALFVRWWVGLSCFTFCYVFAVFGLTAPAPELYYLPLFSATAVFTCVSLRLSTRIHVFLRISLN